MARRDGVRTSMDQSLICLSCGKANDLDARFCVFRGAEMVIATASGPISSTSPTPSVPSGPVPLATPPSVAPDAPALVIREGDLLEGRYQMDRLLGKGGMGEVWRATDNVLNLVVAAKIVPGWLPDDRKARETLISEAKLGMKLSRPRRHPNVQVVYHVDAAGRYLIMELI